MLDAVLELTVEIDACCDELDRMRSLLGANPSVPDWLAAEMDAMLGRIASLELKAHELHAALGEELRRQIARN